MIGDCYKCEWCPDEVVHRLARDGEVVTSLSRHCEGEEGGGEGSSGDSQRRHTYKERVRSNSANH